MAKRSLPSAVGLAVQRLTFIAWAEKARQNWMYAFSSPAWVVLLKSLLCPELHKLHYVESGFMWRGGAELAFLSLGST